MQRPTLGLQQESTASSSIIQGRQMQRSCALGLPSSASCRPWIQECRGWSRLSSQPASARLRVLALGHLGGVRAWGHHNGQADHSVRLDDPSTSSSSSASSSSSSNGSTGSHARTTFVYAQASYEEDDTCGQMVTVCDSMGNCKVMYDDDGPAAAAAPVAAPVSVDAFPRRWRTVAMIAAAFVLCNMDKVGREAWEGGSHRLHSTHARVHTAVVWHDHHAASTCLLLPTLLLSLSLPPLGQHVRRCYPDG